MKLMEVLEQNTYPLTIVWIKSVIMSEMTSTMEYV